MDYCRFRSVCSTLWEAHACRTHADVDVTGAFTTCEWGKNIYQGYECRVDFRGATRGIRECVNATTAPLGTGHDWTVLVTVSHGFREFFDNWLTWYRRLRLPSRLSVVAEDRSVFDALSRLNNALVRLSPFHALAVSTQTLGYDTKDYKRLVSRRAHYIVEELQRSPFVLYTDVDTVWKANPFPFLEGTTHDLWGSLDDVIHGVPYYCTGFLGFRASRQAFRLLLMWNDSLFARPQLNQPIFNALLQSSTDVSAAALPRRHFPSGDLAFGIKHLWKSEAVVVLHNNFIQGSERKMRRFRNHGYLYREL